ncbi:MAG: alkaline phosphatase family protein [Nitrososphaeria archaeon]|jgi:hypothetical protein
MDTKLKDEMTDFVGHHSFLDDFVLPDYQNFNVRNISSIIGGIYGIDSLVSFKFPEDYLDDLQGVDKVLLLIIDGLGYSRFLMYIASNRGVLSYLAEKGTSKPLTSTFPATTSTSLTSIFTGMSPSEHNIIGYQMFSKEYGLIFNTLSMQPVYGVSNRIDIAEEYSKKVKPWMSSFKNYNIKAVVVTRGSIVESGLSRVIHRDLEVAPYILESDMLTRCRNELENSSRALVVMYYSGFDALAHRYGPYSEEATSVLQSLEYNLKNTLFNKLSKDTKKKTLILLTADHGVSEVSGIYFFKDYPEILENLLLPPVGDSRATFLFSKNGQIELLKDAFEKKMDGFSLHNSRELIMRGAFGKVDNSKSLETTVGDVIALSRSNNALQYPYFDEDRSRPLLGAHGGMTAEEIIVPLLSSRLSIF